MEIEVTQAGSTAPMQIIKDGVAVTVTKDTGTPLNTIPIPVELVAASGTDINITAGDLNVQLSDQGANADVVRVGDGTTQLAIEVGTGAALTKVTSSALPAGAATGAKQDTGNTSLASIDTKLTSQATGAKQDTGNTSLGSIDTKFTTLNAKDFATSAKQDTGNTSLSSIDGKFTTLNAKDFATSAKQDTGNTSLGSIDTKLTSQATGAKQDTGNTSLSNIDTSTSGLITKIGAVNETAPATDTASSGLNGRLQRIAQRLSSLIALLPAALGQTTKAASLSVALASDTGTLVTSSVAPVATTVKQAAVSVGTAAVRCTTDGAGVSTTRVYLCVQPTADSTTARFFVGSSSVTSSGATRGIEVFPGGTFERSNDAGEYYMISDTAGQTVFVVEQE